jgi:hypothetical protein
MPKIPAAKSGVIDIRCGAAIVRLEDAVDAAALAQGAASPESMIGPPAGTRIWIAAAAAMTVIDCMSAGKAEGGFRQRRNPEIRANLRREMFSKQIEEFRACHREKPKSAHLVPAPNKVKKNQHIQRSEHCGGAHPGKKSSPHPAQRWHDCERAIEQAYRKPNGSNAPLTLALGSRRLISPPINTCFQAG